ncbi:MAG TPA: GNAT family N-acetyltransferase [Streptosporangiaceae bacterium]
MTVHVRDARPGDAPAIAEVHVASWRGAYHGLIPQEILDGLDVPARTQRWTRIIDRTDSARGAVLVAEDDGRIIGFANVGQTRDSDAEAGRTGELTAIYLEPSSWGRGAGRSLMEAAVSRLAALGYADATLWVLDANERARRFYEAARWFPDGTVKTEHADGYSLSEARYRRSLS